MFGGNVFYEIAMLLSMAAVFGFFGLKFKQPLIITFLITGMVAGTSGLMLISDYSPLTLLANMGIALLLFIVGLRLDINLIRSAGTVALATGIGQIFFTAAGGLLIALTMGMSMMTAIYVAIALTFSSTIIIVKLLSDKKEIDSLYGQIAVGFLIVQDIAAILALIVLITLGNQISGEGSLLLTITLTAFKAISFVVAIVLLARFVLSKLAFYLAQSQELIVLFAIAWAILLSAGADMLGLSKEVGAFLAGISLATTQYRDAISSRLLTLRDFLLLFFFINLGANLDIAGASEQIGRALLLSAFVLVGNPLIVMAIMGFMGYRKRTSFMAGLTVAQISEFSLIVIARGFSLGHIDAETVGLVTMVGIVTILGSTYMIIYSEKLYNSLAKYLQIFERKNPYREAASGNIPQVAHIDFILIGLGRFGHNIGLHLLKRGKTFMGMDFDPARLAQWSNYNVPVFYGDISDLDIYEQLPLHKTKWVVSSIRSRELNSLLMKELKQRGYTGKIAVTATSKDDVQLFQKMGAQVVFKPFSDAAEQAVNNLAHAMELIPNNIDWPVAFKEIKIESTFVYSGKTIRDIPLGGYTGVSILAVSRGGKVYYDIGADYQIYPGDSILIMGSPEKIKEAEETLTEVRIDSTASEVSQFSIAYFKFRNCPDGYCESLSALGFRQKYGVTVIGIQRENERITTPDPQDSIRATDQLVVIGKTERLKMMSEKHELMEISKEVVLQM